MHVIILILHFLFMPFSWDTPYFGRINDSQLAAQNMEGQIQLTVFRHENVVGMKGLNIISDTPFFSLELPRFSKNFLSDYFKKLPRSTFITFSSVRYLLLNLQIPPPTL